MDKERVVRFALNDHFYDFVHDWNYKTYLTVGGYGSSKSYHVAIKLMKKLVEEPRKALVLRQVYDTLRDSCFDLLAEVAQAMELSDYLTFTTSPMQVRFSNGSRIIFKGMDKPEKLKSLNGISIVWIEECAEIKYAGFLEVLGRLRHPVMSNHILLSTNPVSKSNWVYRHFFYDKKTGCRVLDEEALYQKRVMAAGTTYYHHSTVDDNYFVPQEYVEQLEELRQHDPDLYRVAREGRFGINGRLVFPQFEVMDYAAGMELVQKIKHPLYRNGMDFGFVESYNSLLRLVIDRQEKILFIIWEYYSRGKDDTEIETDIEEFRNSQELIKADCAEPKTIRYFRKQGFRMQACRKFKGSRAAYTKKVKRFKRIICLDNCPNTIEELKGLTFKEDQNGGVIEDEFNIDPHTLSAIWYALDDYEVEDLKGDGLRIRL